MQFSGKWDCHTAQILQRFLVYGSILYLLSFFIFNNSINDISTTQKNLALFLLIALSANAFICAGISMVDVRFQYKVVWIIHLFAILILNDHSPVLIEIIRSMFEKKEEVKAETKI
ncbi:MAG: hypothetical protein ABJC12_11820 [Saprospiraceae bacterium]